MYIYLISLRNRLLEEELDRLKRDQLSENLIVRR